MVEEPAWQRDARLKGDEARMVRMESQVSAIHDLLVEYRRKQDSDRSEMEQHFIKDDQRFASIDSRLQGFQTQISALNSTADRIEKILSGDEGLVNQVKVLSDDKKAHAAITGFLGSTWTHLAGGGGLVLFIVALYTFITGGL